MTRFEEFRARYLAQTSGGEVEHWLPPSATLESIAAALGGEIDGNRVLCPSPGRASDDRSMVVTVNKAGQPWVYIARDRSGRP